MPKVTLTWQTRRDNHVCPICEALEDYSWIVETGKDVFPTELSHPAYGVVWTIALGSEAHGKHKDTCRCRINSTVSIKDLIAKATNLRDELIKSVQQTVPEANDEMEMPK
jgi:hypothetical protein